MFVIDQYAYQNRWKHIPAVYKFILYLIFLGVSFSGVAFIQLPLIFLLVPLTCYVARVPFKRYLHWYLQASIFILISLITFVVTYSSQQEGLWLAFPFGSGYFGVSHESVSQMLLIALRIYSSLVSTYFFVLVVPFSQLLSLLKSMKCPAVLIELMLLMYRFIFLVMHEFVTIRETLDLKFAFLNKRRRYKAWGRLANTLFVKVLSDNEQLNEVLRLKFDASHYIE